ncbi:hypothetical protein AAHE18_14G035800 [Arachis hypogaea]
MLLAAFVRGLVQSAAAPLCRPRASNQGSNSHHSVSLLLHVVVAAPLKRPLLCRTTRRWLSCSALTNVASDSSC